MSRFTGARALLHTLEQHGIGHLFGIPGHGAYPLYDALNDVPAIRPIVGRNEQGITFAAVAYAWVSGDVAVATAVPEAGLTNAATPILEATLSQDKLLFLVEHDPLHSDLVQSIARYHRIVDDPEQIAGTTAELIALLRSSRPGAAVMEVTNAALSAEVGRQVDAQTPSAPMIDDGMVRRAAQWLNGRERVAICAGASALDSADELRLLAERLAAPVIVDGFAKGLLPEDHPLALGHCWTPGGPAADLLREADAVLVIGTPVSVPQNRVVWDPALIRSAGNPDELMKKLLLVDWDDTVQGELPAHTRLRGAVRPIIGALAGAVSPKRDCWPQSRLDQIRQVADSYARSVIPDAHPVFEALRAELPDDVILLTDSLLGIWADWLVPARGPRSVRFPWGTGTLGWSIPAAIGAKLACPDRTVVAIGGDGATLFNAQELATARLYDLNPIIVVANDNAFSAIRCNMLEDFGRSTAHVLSNPDFVTLATAFGFEGKRLNEPRELAAALADSFVASKPCLLEVPLELRPPRGLYNWEM